MNFEQIQSVFSVSLGIFSLCFNIDHGSPDPVKIKTKAMFPFDAKSIVLKCDHL